MTDNPESMFSIGSAKGASNALAKAPIKISNISSKFTDAFSNLDLSGFQDNAIKSIELPSAKYADLFSSYQSASPDLRTMWHQLIIIGNGFDLECGLRSSFASFFEARNDEFSTCKTVEPRFTKTIWDELLKDAGDSNWCDIESAIADWIAPEEGTKDTRKIIFRKTLKKLIDGQEQSTFGYDSSKLEDCLALYLRNRFADNNEDWSPERLVQITHDDLNKLEDDFSRYLTDVVNHAEGYKAAVGKLMSEIILWHHPNMKDFDIEESILSFNYTHAVKNFHSDEHATDYINIHGRLGEEIVFGIDGTNRMDDPVALPFTKTYRLMALDLPDTDSLIHIPARYSPMNHGTSIIKFYGHSLGKADYSYFQAIFDAVKLYESNTKLVFFFRPHCGSNSTMGDIEMARKDMMDRAIKLLTAYGVIWLTKSRQQI